MKKTFDFGKINYYNRSGKKINKVEVVVELRQDGDKKVFTACGYIYNNRGNIISGGQNLDEIAEYIHTPLFNEIHHLWKLYHLNDTHAGTAKQEQALIEHFGHSVDYDKACEYLESIDLYEDKEYIYKDAPYRYGSGWLYQEIPQKDLDIINELLSD